MSQRTGLNFTTTRQDECSHAITFHTYYMQLVYFFIFSFAYIQFTDVEGMQNSLSLTDSLFLGRQIKVMAKRTNKPGISSTNRPPRGRGVRGRVIVKYIYPGAYRGSRSRPPRFILVVRFSDQWLTRSRESATSIFHNKFN